MNITIMLKGLKTLEPILQCKIIGWANHKNLAGSYNRTLQPYSFMLRPLC